LFYFKFDLVIGIVAYRPFFLTLIPICFRYGKVSNYYCAQLFSANLLECGEFNNVCYKCTSMNTLNPNTPTRMLSKRKPLYRFPLIPVSVLVICLSFLFLYHYYVKPNSEFSRLDNISTSHTPQCSSQTLTLGEKFMWYAPHSGFSNQLSEFKNAVLMAGILNRTLVVPPILDHHAVALGSCPKFRVLDPKDIRISVWDHVIELVQSRRLVSFVTHCQLMICDFLGFKYHCYSNVAMQSTPCPVQGLL